MERKKKIKNIYLERLHKNKTDFLEPLFFFFFKQT